MKKQTAVEWLVNELNQKIDYIPMDKWDMIRDIVQQAKAMEKEKIESAYREGYNDCSLGRFADAEQYYNYTFL